MSFTGFHDEDFDVFTVDGLDDRMDAIKTKVRPKLEQLGDMMAPALSTFTGEEMFPHVAKHARRTVNPPDDTWVAFAANKRGYKKLPHFQIGLWETHVFVWFAVINEAPDKKDIAQRLDKHLSEITSSVPEDYVWSEDHTEPDAVPAKEADLDHIVNRLKTVKKAEILCGRHFERGHPLLADGEKLVREIENTFQTVLPLYKWARGA